MDEFEICGTWGRVAPFVDAARAASDANSHALGFLRSVVFDRYAKQGKLLVAVSRKDGKYIGHLLFDYSYPRATVLQTFSILDWRGRGVGKALLNTLKSTLQADRFLSIRAAVAEDLFEANRFYQSAGFYIARRRKGGATTGRMILERVHELDSPQLFARSGLALRPDDSLGLGAVSATSVPVYLIDLNVVFDLAHKRLCSEDAARLLHASHSGDCRVLVSAEMLDELLRHTKDEKVDPMIRMLATLPRVPVPKDPFMGTVAPTVARAIFPEKTFPGGLSANDRSDVRHVVTAIHCQAAAFVTRDHRILDAAPQLEKNHCLKILLPDQLWGVTTVSTQEEVTEAARGEFFIAAPKLGQQDEVHDLLHRCGISPVDVAAFWLTPNDKGAGFTIKLGRKLLAFAVPAPHDPHSSSSRMRVVVDESHESCSAAARLILKRACDAAERNGCAQLKIEMPEKQSILKETAFRLGFRAATSSNSMTKIIMARASTAGNWTVNRKHLHDSAGILLPKEPPLWKGSGQLLDIQCPDGERRHVSLHELETLLSPALFCLPNRPATMVSIRPKFSDALLGNRRQFSMAPQLEAASHQERLFLSAPRLLGQFDRGGLLFFYQSQSRGEQAIIAVARTVESYLIRRDELGEDSLRRSVLRADSVMEIGSSPDKAACLFDNLIFLPNPVKLSFLEKKLNYHRARLTSANRLNHDMTAGILEEGFGCG